MARITAKGVLRLVAINLLVFLVIVVCLNLISGLLLDIDFKRDLLRDERADLPSYEDHARAALILHEFHELKTRYEPFVVWSRRPFQGETTTVDAAGDRVHPATTDHPEGVVRFFGGSAMWGTGVDDLHTVPARFNAHHPELRVHNHGESAFHSRHEVARLVNLVSQHEPTDVVVFYDGYNDAVNLCRFGVPLTGSQRAAQIDRRVNPGSHFAYALVGAVRELVFKIVPGRSADDPSDPCTEDPDYANRVADTMIENWRMARAITQLSGGEFVAVLQPAAPEGHGRVDHLKPAERQNSAVSLVYARVRYRLSSEPIPWVYDLSDVFDGDEFIYIDAVHTNAIGTERVARRLAGIVSPMLDKSGR